MNAFKSSDKILITGGTGFIGKHLAKRCLQDTPHIVCIALHNNFNENLQLKEVKVYQADVKDKDTLKSVLNNEAFDYVFNLNGYIDHTPYFKGGRSIIESHLIGLMNIIDCLDKTRLKGFVQIGSSDEYGSASAPQQEGMREMPISPYSLAKMAATHFIQMLAHTEDFPGVVLRLFLTYGPGQDDKRFLPQIIKACLNNEAFKTSEGAQVRDFCYVEDTVTAMVEAAINHTSKGHIINIGSGTPITIKEVIKDVIVMSGGGKPLWGTYPYRKGENMALYPVISKAKDLLGWNPKINFNDGLMRTIEYYKQLTVN